MGKRLKAGVNLVGCDRRLGFPAGNPNEKIVHMCLCRGFGSETGRGAGSAEPVQSVFSDHD